MSLNRENVQLQVYCRAPAPSRDYCGLTITLNEIILNIWNVSHGPHVYPKRIKCEIDDFAIDKRLQNEVQRLFGDHVLNYVISISKNEHNIHYLPTKVFLCILKYLAASDIIRLSQTSKIFFEICNRDPVWNIIFKKRYPRPNYVDLRNAEERGWREALKMKFSSFLKHDNKQIKLNNTKTINARGNKLDTLNNRIKSTSALFNEEKRNSKPKLTSALNGKYHKIKSHLL